MQVSAKKHTMKKNFIFVIIFLTAATMSGRTKVEKMDTTKKAPMMDANEWIENINHFLIHLRIHFNIYSPVIFYLIIQGIPFHWFSFSLFD